MFVQLTQDVCNQPAGQRLDFADADAQRLIEQGRAEPLDHDPVAPLLTRALDDSLDRAFQRWTHAAGRAQRVPRVPFTGQGDAASDDPRAGFKNFGEFAIAVKDACQPGKRPDDRLHVIAKAASGMGEAFGSDGGFLVPPEFLDRLLQRIYSQEQLLGRTDNYTIQGNSISFPRIAETSRANGSRWGGVRAYWREEGDQGTSSKPSVGRMQLNLHKLFVLIHSSDELLADTQGLALEQYLMRVASDEINFVVGDAIINGTGAGQPMGLLNSSCLVTVNKESGQTANTLVAQNVVNMWARLFAPCRQNAVWLINQDVESQMHSMTVGTGSAATLAYLPPGGLSTKPYATLLGRPVLPVEWCATLGTVGDIILADLRHYVTATRGAVNQRTSTHLRFDFDESVFRFTFRVDGQPWWSAPLTPYKGTNTQSCFVTLQTRS
ncbi:MAG: phage major capsid protein [Gemmataceae bacterium]|nr:phage major capsid protein [Gemmataceae bacterium]MCI0741308.1 phage major capsid protein [Gemmataceae bacterium]